MYTRCAILTAVLCAYCPSTDAAEPPSKLAVDGTRAKEFVAQLSTNAMEGRMSGTEGYRQAADWAAAQFASWGLKPAGEQGTWFQQVRIGEFDWRTGTPTLRVRDREFLLDDGDYTVDRCSTPAVTQQAEIVFAGYGIAAPDKGLDEYQGLDVSGKIVLVLKGTPSSVPPLRQRFEPEEEAGQEKKEPADEEQWKDESTDSYKIKVAHDKGAAAIMLYDPDASSTSQPRRDRSSRSADSQRFQPQRPFVCVTIQERVYRAIMRQDPQQSPQGLKRSTDQIRREIKNRRAQSRATGVQATVKGFDTSVRYDDQQGNNVARNVLAKIEGTDPQLKGQYVLVGAHLDHIGVRDGYVYNGADDNASGSAVVLEVARVLAESHFQPKRTLIFCCWCGEEQGLLGSVHYADQPSDGVNMDQVVAYFNLDMVGMGDVLGASGALNFPSIWKVIQRDQDPQIMQRVKPRVGGPGGSDHTPFIERGIEAMMLMSSGGAGHQDYHQPEDDTEKIEPEMLRVAGQFVLQGVQNLSSETEENLLVARRQDRYRALQMEIRNLNPDLADSRWTRVEIKAKTQPALYDEIFARARELLKQPSSPQESGSAASDEQPRPVGAKSLTRGLADFKLVADDMRLLGLVVDFHGIGRADIAADDGVWIAQGRLTDRGREALGVLEENQVVVRLMSPSQTLVEDMLSTAQRPFIITGDCDISRAMAERMSNRGVQLGICLDPQDVGQFIARAEKARELLGERRNLFVFLTATKGLDEAKTPLYLGLVDRGWTHREICGGREHGGLVGGAGLENLGRP